MKTKMMRPLILFLFCIPFWALSKPAPELPGEEVTESKEALEKSDKNVTELAVPNMKNKSKWAAPSINEQLARDKTLIGLGYGALFIPSFSEPRLEPDVLVYKSGGGKLTPGNSGQRILLQEGSYLIRIGSGNLEQKIKYLVSIDEGKTTIVKPVWAGLNIEVLDSDGDYTDNEYDLYNMETGESFGKGHGLKEERIKDIKTWILKPGIYKITKVGESFGSITNYITVQLNPGELTNVELVFDADTEELIAGGRKDLSTKRKVGLNWRYGVRVGGNVSLNSRVVDGKEHSRIISTLFDFKFRAKYDNSKFLGINEIRTKNIFQWEKDRDPSSVTDEIRVRSSWVRRLNKFIGPYVSFKLESGFFPTEQPIEPEDSVFVEDETGDVISMIINTDEANRDSIVGLYPGQDIIIDENLEISPSFYPIEMGTGVGVNLELLTYYYLELSSQLGVGARQTFNKDELVTKSETETNYWVPIESFFQIGLENNFNARIRLGSRLTLDAEAEFFFEDGLPSNYKIEEFNTDLRFNLTRHIELSYLFEIDDRLVKFGETDERYEYLHGVLLRISINI